MIQIFGVIDLLAALSFLLLKFNVKFIPIIFAVYLIVKGLIFFTSIVSWVDVVCGILMLIAFYFGFSNFMWIAVLWIAQKGFFSLVS